MPRRTAEDELGEESRASGTRSGPKESETAQQALDRARLHMRAAGAEALAAARALLDAASIATVGQGAESHRALGVVARGIDELAASLSADGPPAAGPLFEAILDALDAEIARWEVRSRDDMDARAVLRAFLGLREILWEFGVRPSAPAAGRSEREAEAPAQREPAGKPKARRKTPPRRPPPRVQRIEIQ